MKSIVAVYYDGRTPLRQPAELLAVGDEIVARGAFGEYRAQRTGVEISEPMGRSPRFVRFADGATFEVADLDGFAVWLAAARFNDSAVVRLQSHWSWALGSMLGTVVLVAAIYLWGSSDNQCPNCRACRTAAYARLPTIHLTHIQ